MKVLYEWGTTPDSSGWRVCEVQGGRQFQLQRCDPSTGQWRRKRAVKRTSVHPIAVIARLAQEVSVLRRELRNARELLDDSGFYDCWERGYAT